MEYKEFSGSSLEDAITAATIELGVTSDRLDYQVVEEGSSGFFGFGSKDCKIRAKVKNEEAVLTEAPKEEIKEEAPVQEKEVVEIEDTVSPEMETAETTSEDKDAVPVDLDAAKAAANVFLNDLFGAMDLEVHADMNYDEENNSLNIELSGPEMGIIIGKRGATLDSVQYLANLAVNRKLESYVRIKIDTEDYRFRRKQTLENLAKNVAYKVKRSRRPVSLEAMNPYERRIIHYALQNDNYVSTHSEGEEPYRHIVVVPK